MRKLRTGGARFVVLSGMLLLAAGCAVMRPVDGQERESARGPAPWDAAELQSHLRALRGRAAAGRTTGSAGFAVAADYASTRMREFGLQPVAVGTHRHLYFTPLNGVTAARVIRMAPDTVAFDTGAGLLPDARSRAGRVRTDRVDRVAAGTEPVGEVAPVIAVGPADTASARLSAWERAGVRGVLEAVDPVPGRRSRPLGSMVIVQVAPDMLDEVLGAPDGPGTERIPVDLELEVAGAFEPAAAAINVLGYVAGRDPWLASELVVIGADLDGSGLIDVDPDADTLHAGIGAAALLECARVLSGLALAGRGPDRTVLFALWSGSMQGGAGAAAWMANPSWPPDAVRQVIQVAGPSADRLRRAGFEVTVVGSDAVPAGPDAAFGRSVDAARRLAYDLLATGSDLLWDRDGGSRVPPLNP